ncbi:pepsin-like aspartic protease [Aspergillus puulaauensis]|uniref:Aspergillopepsin-1 n=1 Tax=Aspergillus puulaauensis TaxID=1220207 RepID=A0A7R7XTU8_9EURO|nr:type I transmembrane sorting receptor [Aspergillus puulaauensis]BCS26773.1 type I transmembrane sorting receptor [Aspergillus puulaauensis]
MVVFSKVTTIALGLSTVASALPGVKPRKCFTVNQVVAPKSAPKPINIPGVYASALGKYGATVPQHVKDAAGSGSVIANPEEEDSQYLTPVTVGGKVLNLDFDTGSADLWVFSTELPASEQSGHSTYKPAGNSTKLDGYTWEISYGDGSGASGDVYKDTVSVGSITARGQAVESAKKISEQFVQTRNNDGLLGLAFSAINTVQPKPQKTFFDTVKGELDAPLFAVALKHHAPGAYDFGFIDKKKYNGSIAYADVDSSDGFWKFTADSYGVGDGDSNSSSSLTGIADTGTTLMMLDDEVVSAYYDKVSSAKNDQQAGGWVFPCDTDVPAFTLTIGNYVAVVPGKHINWAPLTEGSETCFGGIQSNQGLGFSILGDVFLKSQYVIFDSRGPKLGFAPQA